MNRGYGVSSEGGSPIFSIDRSGDLKKRPNANRDRGKYAPYHNSPPAGYNSSSPGNSSGQESPDFLPFGFSSPNRCYGSDSGRGNWTRGPRQGRPFRHNYGHSGFRGKMNYHSSRGNYSSPYRGNKAGKTKPGQGADISLYYHHSMVEDPWAEFDDKLCSSSSSNADSLNISDGSMLGCPNVSILDSIGSPSRVNLTCGSAGSELLESGSDDVSA